MAQRTLHTTTVVSVMHHATFHVTGRRSVEFVESASHLYVKGAEDGQLHDLADYM